MLDRLGQAKKHNAELLVFKKPNNCHRPKNKKTWPEAKMATGEFYFWGTEVAAAGVNFASLNN